MFNEDYMWSFHVEDTGSKPGQNIFIMDKYKIFTISMAKIIDESRHEWLKITIHSKLYIVLFLVRSY